MFLLFTVCKRWNRIGKMSWCNFNKTLNLDTVIWGSINKNKSGQLKCMMLENLLRRCGKFLTQIIGFFDVKFENQENKFLNTIKKECPNLKTLDMDYCFFDDESIRNLKPIFKKIKRFRCSIMNEYCENDQKLKDLFSQNSILESLDVVWENDFSDVSGDFINAIPYQTIKELVFFQEEESTFSIHKICQVCMILINHCKVGYKYEKLLYFNTLNLYFDYDGNQMN